MDSGQGTASRAPWRRAATPALLKPPCASHAPGGPGHFRPIGVRPAGIEPPVVLPCRPVTIALASPTPSVRLTEEDRRGDGQPGRRPNRLPVALPRQVHAGRGAE